MKSISIVCPCFNEEPVIPATANSLLAVLDALTANGKIHADSRIYFVDDGSTDRTWERIGELAASDRRVRGIKLSRNHGHQNALLAGLLTAAGDALISVDADLQDDVGAIADMVDRFLAGIDVVYGVRRRRDSDAWFKRTAARAFYRLMRMLGAEVEFDHADFRLLSRRAVSALADFRETNLFLRGIVPLLGLPAERVYYDRAPRRAGTSKYPLAKSLAFAWDGITSFSIVPLRLITLVGFVTFFVALVLSGWALWTKLFTVRAIPGWASTVLPIYFLGGLQIFAIGIIGEYVGKAYKEAKARPRYIIEKVLEPGDAP